MTGVESVYWVLTFTLGVGVGDGTVVGGGGVGVITFTVMQVLGPEQVS